MNWQTIEIKYSRYRVFEAVQNTHSTRVFNVTSSFSPSNFSGANLSRAMGDENTDHENNEDTL